MKLISSAVFSGGPSSSSGDLATSEAGANGLDGEEEGWDGEEERWDGEEEGWDVRKYVET